MRDLRLPDWVKSSNPWVTYEICEAEDATNNHAVLSATSTAELTILQSMN